MSSYYADLASDLDDSNFIDDELLELESDFAKSNEAFDKPKTESLKTPVKARSFDWLNDDDKPAIDASKRPKSSVRFTDSSDILEGLEDTPVVKPKLESLDKAKKENILSELFGKSSDSKMSSKSNLQELEIPVVAPKSEPSLITTTRKRGERRNSNLLDPLGLFSNKVEETSEKTVPGWLAAPAKPATPSAKPPTPTTTKPSTPITSKPATPTKTLPQTPTTKPETVPNLPPVITSNMEIEKSLSNLHQQESQLLLAVQLKKFEEHLQRIENQQKELQNQQEIQAQMVRSEQNKYQRLMEEQIVGQQERINEHMQILNMPSFKSENTKVYSEEFLVMESCYKKQISLLDESIAANEVLLKSEIDRLTQYYNKKVDLLEQQIDEIQSKSNEKISKFHTQNQLEIERITAHYQNIIQTLNQEHDETIEHIRKNKLIEANIITDNSSFSNMLREALTKFENKSTDLIEIQTYLKNQFDFQVATKEAELKSKEMELKLLLEKAEKQNTILSNDRTKLMSLVETLEIRLSEQIAASKELEWETKHRESRLAAREAALDRETQRIKELTEREKIYLEKIKLENIAENEQLAKQIQQAKLELAAEKSRIETQGLFNKDFDVMKTKAEVDAAIKVAQNAEYAAEQERKELGIERQKLQQERHQLELMERNVRNREVELTNMLQVCERKKEEAAQMLNESKLLEMKYNEQHKSVQNQLASLRVREKKLAEDKVNLNRMYKTGNFEEYQEKSRLPEYRENKDVDNSYLHHEFDFALNKIKYSEDVEK